MENDVKKIMEEYRKKLSSMKTDELAKEWDKQRELVKKMAHYK